MSLIIQSETVVNLIEILLLYIVLLGIFLAILFTIIKSAVKHGIDESNEIKLLKSHLKELNKKLLRIEKEMKEKGKKIDESV